VEATAKGWVGYYPDLAVYCTDEVHPFDPDTRIQPSLLVEVTSKTTEKKDRGVKLEDYLAVKTLDEYLIVSHQRIELELWTRGPKGWTRRLVTEGTVQLKMGAIIDVDHLYADLPD
jgi:Uma2 family endonuclease